jgi:DNA-directed RNA polymerase subunit RPC12/RpoP
VDGGCARCHTGLGKKPTATLTPSQGDLENIDCLICHSTSYKRTVAMVNGSWALLPDATKMTVSLLQAAADIRKPGKDACLNCHTKAGGGDNFKRGDLSEAHRSATVTAALDVHMAPTSAGGAGLECTDCHTTTNHRIAGRGVDMRVHDSDQLLECSNCHSNLPHDDSRLNSHTARVACNVCHVPTFAKGAPTDMRRDWSKPGVVSEVTRLFEPDMVFDSNVKPEYKFFNGKSKFYEFATPAERQTNGLVLMAGPLGSRTDAGAKITAMKRHTGRQPMDPVTKWLIPLKIGIFFQTANLELSVSEGIKGVAWADNGWANNAEGFAETERYMGVYHEVAPASQALSCSSCHGGTRLNFADLGYTPNATRDGKALCSSCHGAKPMPSFMTLHQKHVTDKKLDCINCHTFSKG